MKNLTYEQLGKVFEKHQQLLSTPNNRQRIGQAFFNALNYVSPEHANAIRGSALDPFHKREFVNQTILLCIDYLMNEIEKS